MQVTITDWIEYIRRPDDKVDELQEIDARPVESYPPNGYGLYNVLGKVSELTETNTPLFLPSFGKPSIYDEGRVDKDGC